MTTLNNFHLWFRTPLQMAVPSNSFLFKGVGGDFGNRLCVHIRSLAFIHSLKWQLY